MSATQPMQGPCQLEAARILREDGTNLPEEQPMATTHGNGMLGNNKHPIGQHNGPKAREPSRAKDLGKKGNKGKYGEMGKGKEPGWTPPMTPAPALPNSGTSGKESSDNGQYQQLLKLLKQKQQELPLEVQTALQATQVQDARATTRQLHTAVAQLGVAKKNVQQLAHARLQLHQQWTTFLQDAVERWKGFATDFQTQDQDLLAKLEEAKKHMQHCQEHFKACQTKPEDDNAPVIVSDDEDVPMLSTSVGTNIETMVTSLQALHTQMELEEANGAKKRKVEVGDASKASA